MISALAGGGPGACGLIGVTRLIDTGAFTGTTPLATMRPLAEVVTETMTVPVWVPACKPVGFASTVSLIPSGGSEPLDGVTLTSHGCCGSRDAVNGKLPSGKPGTYTMIGTSVVLPEGALTFGFPGAVTGASTTRTVTEFGPKAFAQAKNARTR